LSLEFSVRMGKFSRTQTICIKVKEITRKLLTFKMRQHDVAGHVHFIFQWVAVFYVPLLL